jgi:hypothetical protein
MNLAQILDQEMRNVGKEKDNSFIFLNSGNFSGAYEIRGRYTEKDDIFHLTARVFRGKVLVEEFTFDDASIDVIIESTAQKCLQIIESDFGSD